MANITVMNLNDAGAGSLRAAIALADASAGADTIDFAPGLTGTITLTSGELTLSTDVYIEGGGLITISGNDASRVFDVTGGTSTLHALTMTHGYSGGYGGGVQVLAGDLTIADSTLSANSAA